MTSVISTHNRKIYIHDMPSFSVTEPQESGSNGRIKKAKKVHVNPEPSTEPRCYQVSHTSRNTHT